MESRTSILVVEDERAIRNGLCDLLDFHEHEATGVETGEEGLRLALTGQYSLILLDVMLPGLSGFDVCRKVREIHPSQPVLMLTAKGSEDDILEGFRCGADDYVTKPFSVAQLVARVDALLRRSTPRHNSHIEPFEAGPWHVDPLNREAINGQNQVELTQREVDLLALFHAEAGRILSRRRLLIEVWGMQPGADVQTRTVDMHIAKLRKKLGETALGIDTVRGEGYRYRG